MEDKTKLYCPRCGCWLNGNEDDEGQYLFCTNAKQFSRFVQGCVWTGSLKEYQEDWAKKAPV